MKTKGIFIIKLTNQIQILKIFAVGTVTRIKNVLNLIYFDAIESYFANVETFQTIWSKVRTTIEITFYLNKSHLTTLVKSYYERTFAYLTECI